MKSIFSITLLEYIIYHRCKLVAFKIDTSKQNKVYYKKLLHHLRQLNYGLNLDNF